MKKSELVSAVKYQKRRIGALEDDVLKLRRELDAMAECLNIEYVPQKTSKMKYKIKKALKGRWPEEESNK